MPSRLTSKYRAVRTVCRAKHSHASKRESARCDELHLMVKGKQIRELIADPQPRYPLVVNGVKVGTYVADFYYFDIRKKVAVVEDVKGMPTPVYRLKKKLVKALYGIEISEV